MKMVRIDKKYKLLHSALYSQTVLCVMSPEWLELTKKYSIVCALHSLTYNPTVMSPINIRTRWLTQYQ